LTPTSGTRAYLPLKPLAAPVVPPALRCTRNRLEAQR
jgi:hypothetical protein